MMDGKGVGGIDAVTILAVNWIKKGEKWNRIVGIIWPETGIGAGYRTVQ